MSRVQDRYKKFERTVTLLLAISLLVFIVFLIVSGLGIIWLQVLCSIVAILLCCLCLVMLILSRELLRQRSLWMSIWAVATILCILFSLLLHYPSPNPYSVLQGSSGYSADETISE